MNLPVLIPAHNEARELGGVLESLPRDVHPLVLANGCSDDTVAIAESFGAAVLDFEEPSKLIAIQHGLRHIGSAAQRGYALMDADTRLVSGRFAEGVYHRLGTSRDAVIAGVLLYRSETSDRLRPDFSVLQALKTAINIKTREGYFPIQ